MPCPLPPTSCNVIELWIWTWRSSDKLGAPLAGYPAISHSKIPFQEPTDCDILCEASVQVEFSGNPGNKQAESKRPMEQATNIALHRYVDLFYRKKYLLVWLLLISLPIGLGYYLKTPKVYQSTALLTYKPSRVNTNPMAPEAEARDLRETVGTTSQVLVSVGNLEELIKKFDLYPGERARLPMQDVVDIMRKDITIQPARTGNAFQITYSGTDQSKVMKVANELAGRFIEISNAGSVEETVRIATYTEGEMTSAKTVMDQKDQVMRDYKKNYFNEMPDQRIGNVQRLVSLQEQYRKNQDAILNAQQTKALWQEQLNSLRNASFSASDSAALQGQAPVIDVDPLTRLRNRLPILLSKYTENHPEVKKVRAQIEKMEAEPWTTGTGSTSEAAKSARSGDSVAGRSVMQYEAQIKNYDAQIAALTKANEEIQKQAQQLQKWVEAAPNREAEWSSLTRDYEVLKKQYDKLVEKNLQAQSALNQARRQQAGQFRIEDSARFPETPFQPNFRRIMGASIVFTAGVAAVVVLFSAFFDQSFRIPVDVENYLKLPVVSIVSYIPTEREKKRARIMFIVKALALFLAGLLVMSYFAWAWSMGKIVI